MSHVNECSKTDGTLNNVNIDPIAAKKMLGEFIDEANSFLDEFWEDAEKLGYKRSSESDALTLVSYFFFGYCETYPGERDSVYRSFGHSIEKPDSETHQMLGNALAMYFIAATDYSIKCLMIAGRCLEASRQDAGSHSLLGGVSVELMSKALSHAGKLGAIKSHVDDARLKQEAFAYWEANIDSKLSNEKAAEILKKQYPLAHRTLSGYVSEWKKIRPGAKP